MQDFDQADNALLVRRERRGACAAQRVNAARQHRHLLLPPGEGRERVLHVLRGLEGCQPVGGQHLCLLPLGLFNLCVDAREVEKAPAQPEHARGLAGAAREQVAAGDRRRAPHQAAERQLGVVLRDGSANARIRCRQAALGSDEVRPAPEQVAGRACRDPLGRAGDVARCGEFCAVGAWGRSQDHIHGIHRRVQGRIQHGDRRLRLRERAFRLPHLEFCREALAVQQPDVGQQTLLGLYLLAGHLPTGLQATHGDVDVCRLRRHGQPGGHGARFRGLVFGGGRLSPPAQAAEHVQLPAGAQVGLVGAAIPVKAWHRTQDLPQGRLCGLVGPRCLARHGGRRQQCGVCSAQPRTRLGHTGSGLGQVKVLLQRQRNKLRQLRVAKAGPPMGQIRLHFLQRLLSEGALLKLPRQGGRGADIVRPHGTASGQAGHKKGGKGVFGQHGFFRSRWG